MFDYSHGLAATWDVNALRPVKHPPPRKFPGGHPLDDEKEWLRGYDDGLKMSEAYRRGRKAGLAGEEAPERADEGYLSGHWVGNKLRLRRLLRPLLPDRLRLVVHRQQHGFHDDISGEAYRWRESYTPLTRRELLNGCLEVLLGRYPPPLPQTLEQCVRLYELSQESEWGARVLTRREARRQRQRQRHERMELAARAFAASCGQAVGTWRFLRELKRAVCGNRRRRKVWNGGEVRMEEWAAHRHAGSGAYFDDLNYVNGRFHEEREQLREVWRYVQRQFPLTVLRYRERQARRGQRRDTRGAQPT